MKAVISNKIYMSSDLDLLKKISEELTYKIPNPKPGGRPILIQSFSRINDNIISIPVGRTDLIPKDYTIVDKRAVVPANFGEFTAKLRESQQQIHDVLDDNWLINAKPGWGKTFTAIAIAKKLGLKTLVITHTVDIRKQWEREVATVLGIKAGVIGGGKAINTNAPIVISNIQTLVKYIDEFKHSFGTVIIDECHHVPATTFTNVLANFSARYKIGLSGTLSRKDGKHVLIYDYISKKVYTPPKENVMDPLILVYKSDIKIPGNHMMPWATRINQLVENPEYRTLIIQFAEAQAQRGHKVLVVSDRVEFLHYCAENTENAVCVTSKVEDRREVIDKVQLGDTSIIYGTMSIFKEGISENALSCLILATAVNNEHMIVQLIGRIIREREGKIRPEALDIVLAGDTGRRQFNTRLRGYVSEGYEIKYLN